MATTARKIRTYAAGGAVLVLALGILIGFFVGSRGGDSPVAPPPTELPATSEPTPTAEPPTGEPGSRTAISCVPSAQSGLVSQGGGVVDAFAGSPSEPQAFCDSQWDIAVSSRDTNTFYELEPMLATHGADCAGPPAQHQHGGNYEQAVFRCRDHVMTAIKASGYGVVYLTPAAMVDFSNGEAVIKFDVSTVRHSGRDWIDIWITPWEDNLQLPLDDYFPDLQGEPRRAIHVKMDGPLGDTEFKAYVVDNFVQEQLPLNWKPLETVLDAPESQRDTFELRISKDRIQFGMPKYGVWWADTALPDLGWSTGVVQLGHHSYNPEKDSSTDFAGTWHWDNVSISPAVPFTIARADYRYVDSEEGQEITFSSAAGANAHLRFSAVGTIELSFDGGKSWQTAQRQAEEFRKPEHFSNYWTPVPAGTKSVMVRGSHDDWFYEWFAKDFAIWTPGATTTASVTR